VATVICKYCSEDIEIHLEDRETLGVELTRHYLDRHSEEIAVRYAEFVKLID
jgi:hypothetical protein